MKQFIIAAVLLLSIASVSSADTIDVQIIDYSFMPSSVTVKAGDTVR